MCRYNVLPPGLLMLSAITRLRFCDIPQQPLPPLEPLLQMPNLQQVAPFLCCFVPSIQVPVLWRAQLAAQKCTVALFCVRGVGRSEIEFSRFDR